MHYDFAAPGQVVFGWGRRGEAGALAATLGRRAFVVCGSRTLQGNGTLNALLGRLRAAGVEPIVAGTISREPEVSDVDQMTADVRHRSPGPGDLVLAIGGGAALDLGKAVAALVTQPAALGVQAFLEGVGTGATLTADPLPVLAMPTTSGTGSEATKNAVISSYAPKFKKSLRSARMVPRIVLIDPELTVSLPPHVTAWTGMDALTQLIESYISCKAQPIPQALALEGLDQLAPALVTACVNGSDRRARERLAHAAFLSGQALANSGLGLAHGVAAALGVHAKTPHGLACAVMLPAALRVNQGAKPAEYARLAEVLTGERDADPADGARRLIDTIDELTGYLGIPRRLSELGVRGDQIPDLVAGSHGNSLSGNPRPLSDAELTDILREML